MTWQPIKTAPKDQLIMLWRPDAYLWAKCDIAIWCEDNLVRKSKPYWQSLLIQSKVMQRCWYPTHWQPLPQPPTQPTTEEP
jgi:hypothetical protein